MFSYFARAHLALFVGTDCSIRTQACSSKPIVRFGLHCYVKLYDRYLDTLQRSEEEYAALKDNIKAAKDAKKKVKPR